MVHQRPHLMIEPLYPSLLKVGKERELGENKRNQSFEGGEKEKEPPRERRSETSFRRNVNFLFFSSSSSPRLYSKNYSIPHEGESEAGGEPTSLFSAWRQSSVLSGDIPFHRLFHQAPDFSMLRLW